MDYGNGDHYKWQTVAAWLQAIVRVCGLELWPRLNAGSMLRTCCWGVIYSVWRYV